MNPGDQVTVTNSQHPDVRIGTVGVIEELKGDGYGVRITQKFKNATNVGSTDETRVIWFRAGDVEPVK